LEVTEMTQGCKDQIASLLALDQGERNVRSP